jgi:hypothetical protein
MVFAYFLVAVLGLELKASCLLGECFMTSATLPALTEVF